MKKTLSGFVILGDLENVKKIIYKNKNNIIDIDIDKALEFSSYYGYYDIVKLLLDNGANPFYNGNISMLISKARKQYNVYNLLKIYARKYKINNILKNDISNKC